MRKEKNKKVVTSHGKSDHGMRKINNNDVGVKRKPEAKRIITMAALDDVSTDEEDQNIGVVPPEECWGDDAKELKKAIESGVFEQLLLSSKKKHTENDNSDSNDSSDSDTSIEEVELGSDYDDDDECSDTKQNENDLKKLERENGVSEDENDDSSAEDNVSEGDAGTSEDSDDSDGDHEEDEDMEEEQVEMEGEDEVEKIDSKVTVIQENNNEDQRDKSIKTEIKDPCVRKDDNNMKEPNLMDNNDDNSSEEEEESLDDETLELSTKVKSNSSSINTSNNLSSKALRVVTESLQSEKKNWPWAETFDIIVKTPLPFGKVSATSTTSPDVEQESTLVSVHDDLKREVAFYNIAMEAAIEAKKKCIAASIPFSRPDDFFAEMVKTDDHMARVKDRLIFETKKMDAVAQRKIKKEQKLRSKEVQSNRIAEKAKKKKDHFQQLDEWAHSAASNRGKSNSDLDETGGFFKNNSNGGSLKKSKKRQLADQKFGFGGKRGRFKQNDPKDLNDFSKFNPRVGGIGPKGMPSAAKNSAGSNRKGKRARDAKRRR